MDVKFLAPAALASLLLGAAVAPAPAVAQAAAVTDSSFIQMAGSLGLLQAKRINPHIDRIYALEEVKQALNDISGRRIKGKAIIRFI